VTYDTETIINQAWDDRKALSATTGGDIRSAVDAALAGLDEGRRGLLLLEIKAVARDFIFKEPTLVVREAASTYLRWLAIANWSIEGIENGEWREA